MPPGTTDAAASRFWFVTKAEVSIPAKIIDPKQREQIHGIVGTYESTRQTILHDTGDVLGIMAIISFILFLTNKQHKTIPDMVGSTVIVYDPNKVLG